MARVVIVVKSGCVQEVIADEEMEYLLVDRDTEEQDILEADYDPMAVARHYSEQYEQA